VSIDGGGVYPRPARRQGDGLRRFTGLEPQGRQAEAENPAPPASAKTGGVQDGEQMTTHDNGGYDLEWQAVPKHCGEICFERVCPVCRETLKIPPNIELGSE
jgi:hypothetical protein